MANGDSQQYCLRWNNHRSNLLNVFDQLLQTEAFTDVTLAVNGTSIKCHKMVLAACSSYFQSLFMENSCTHPIVVFKDIQYSEIRAILEYMYRGEVNVAQEELPSLLKVAEALRVKGLFEEDSDSVGMATSSANNPATSNAQSRTPRSTSGLNSGKVCSADSLHSLSSSSSNGSAKQNNVRARSATPPRNATSSPQPPPSSSPVPPSPQVQLATAEAQNLLYSRHPFLYKSTMMASQGEQGGPLGMWPPLMPLHLGAIESALREREHAMALASLQRDREEKDVANASGREHDVPSGGSGSSASSTGGNKRKRLSSLVADAEGPLLRSFLGPHAKSGDIPALFPFRLAGEGTSDERNPLGIVPNLMAYSERQISREKDDEWSQNPDMASEDDQAEVSGDYGGHAMASPISDKRGDASGARIAAYVPTQKLEWKRYKQYTTSDISAAIEAVRNGMSALQASRKFKVPSRTLYDKVKKLGIATTRPYSRVSSSSSSTASLNQSPASLSGYTASSAAFSSVMASALSLVKRERGPVIQVAGSSAEDNPLDANNDDGSQHTPENLAPPPPTPPNGKDRHDDGEEKREKNRSSPYALPQHPFFSVRDEINSAADAAEGRRTASPTSGST